MGLSPQFASSRWPMSTVCGFRAACAQTLTDEKGVVGPTRRVRRCNHCLRCVRAHACLGRGGGIGGHDGQCPRAHTGEHRARCEVRALGGLQENAGCRPAQLLYRNAHPSATTAHTQVYCASLGESTLGIQGFAPGRGQVSRGLAPRSCTPSPCCRAPQPGIAAAPSPGAALGCRWGVADGDATRWRCGRTRLGHEVVRVPGSTNATLWAYIGIFVGRARTGGSGKSGWWWGWFYAWRG